MSFEISSLPQVILSQIASYIPQKIQNDSSDGGKLIRPGIATVSRAWQEAIEPLVFQNLHIRDEDLVMFNSIFSQSSGHRRRNFLRHLYFDNVLPTYTDDDCANYESDEERKQNNKAASKALVRLLGSLSQWSENCNVTLVIDMYSPMDGIYRGKERFSNDRNSVDLGQRQDLFDQRYKCSYVSISGLEQLSVPCVRSFMPPQGPRSVHPASLVQLTMAFPNISRIDWAYEEPGLWLALRRQIRKEFIEALKSFEPHSGIRILDVNITPPAFHPNERLPQLSDAPEDPLCVTLHRIISSSNLEKIIYRGQVDPSFFWNRECSMNMQTHICWRLVVDLHVEFDIGTPSGLWYFKHSPDDEFSVSASNEPLPLTTEGYFPPGYGTQEDTKAALAYARSLEQREDDHESIDLQDSFRVIPNDDIMVPMLEAFARCLAHSPALKSAYLTCNLRNSSSEWFVAYGAPGTSCGFESYMTDPDTELWTPRVFFHTENWESPASLLGLFKKIGEEKYGRQASITFLPFLY
jgi:hypothetical protein